MQLTQRRVRTSSARAAGSRPPSALPSKPGGVGSGDSPLSLNLDQRAALRGVGLDPVQDKAAGLDADLGVLDQILSPFRSEPHTLVGLGLLGAYVLCACLALRPGRARKSYAGVCVARRRWLE